MTSLQDTRKTRHVDIIVNGNKYTVYDNGDIFSHYSSRLLKKTYSPTNGYLICGIGYIHRIVATCFIGSIPVGYEVNHINGIKTDNRACNLEIVTKSENAKHAYRTGLAKPPSGERNGGAKLSNDACLELCYMLKEGFSNREIGEFFGLHDRYVSLIRHGKRWGNYHDILGPFPVSNG